MQLEFPLNPTLNQEYTAGSVTWKWDGTRWRVLRTFSAVESAELTAAITSVVASLGDALIFKGTIGTTGTVQTLPTTHEVGWVYKASDSEVVAGQNVEVGDLIVSLVVREGFGNQDTDWAIVQSNIDFDNLVSDLIPAVDETISLGTSSKKFQDLYLAGDSIFLGDLVLKDDEGSLAIFAADGETPAAIDIAEGVFARSFFFEGEAVPVIAGSESGDSDWSLVTSGTYDGAYAATMSVPGLLASDVPIVDLDLNTVEFNEWENIEADWSLIKLVEITDDDEITFYASEEPVEDLYFVIKVVR